MERAESAQETKLVLHLEDDPRFQKDLREAVADLDPAIEVKLFTKAEELFRWAQKGARVLEADKEGSRIEKVAFVIAERKLLGTEGQKKLKTLPETFRQSGRLDEKTPTALFLTDFAGDSFRLGEVLDGAFCNVLLKPFDPPILRQHLRFGLEGQHAPSEYSVHNMKTSAVIEMLKALSVEKVGELGFYTRNERSLPVGRVSKYYGRIFHWEQLTSVFGRIRSSRAHPTRPKEWLIQMDFFALARDQLTQIRSRLLRTKSLDELSEWIPAREEKPVHVLIVGDTSPQGSELSGTLQRLFNDCKVSSVFAAPGPKISFDPPLDLVLVREELMLETLKHPGVPKGVPVGLLSDRPLTDVRVRELSQVVFEVFKYPIERQNFAKRLMQVLPSLRPSQELTAFFAPHEEIVEAGNPIETVQISEVGLVIRYEREFPRGQFRRFVLWQPVELGLPVLTGRCHLSQPDPSQPGKWLNHFAFYGMSDRELKHIRLWMRDNYILSKKS